MSARIAWTGGGDADVLAHDGSVGLTVRSTRPFPPGAPVAGSVRFEGSEPMPLVLKIANGRKVDATHWEIRGRLLSATTELIARLAAATTG